MSIVSKPGTRMIIIGVVAVFVALDLFVEIATFNSIIKLLLSFGVIIAGFTVFLAAITFGIYHSKIIIKKTPSRWYFSLYSLIIVVVTFSMAVLSASSPEINEAYGILIKDIFTPLSSATYGIIGFYFTSSLFRSFRVRNSYVALFLLSGCFVIMANAPVFGAIPILQSTGVWIRQVPGVAGTRGIIIATAIGIVAAGIRTILGYERGSLGGESGGS